MAVKSSQSARRMLAVFEAVAASQPVGVSAVARQLGADKSAVQRDLTTLAEAGWIRAAGPSAAAGWELSPRMLTLARPPHSAEKLRLGARPVLESLRAETGETAYLAVPDGNRFIVLSAAEGHHPLRMVPAVGLVIPMRDTATARVVLPYLDQPAQEELLGGPVPEAIAAGFAQTRALGYAVNDGEVQAGAVAIASVVLDRAGTPVASLVLTGPAERLTPDQRARFGPLLREAARRLSDSLG